MAHRRCWRRSIKEECAGRSAVVAPHLCCPIFGRTNCGAPSRVRNVSADIFKNAVGSPGSGPGGIGTAGGTGVLAGTGAGGGGVLEAPAHPAKARAKPQRAKSEIWPWVGCRIMCFLMHHRGVEGQAQFARAGFAALAVAGVLAYAKDKRGEPWRRNIT